MNLELKQNNAKKFILFIAVGRMVVIEMLTEQRRKRFQKKKNTVFSCNFIAFPLHLNYYKSIIEKNISL